MYILTKNSALSQQFHGQFFSCFSSIAFLVPEDEYALRNWCTLPSKLDSAEVWIKPHLRVKIIDYLIAESSIIRYLELEKQFMNLPNQSKQQTHLDCGESSAYGMLRLVLRDSAFNLNFQATKISRLFQISSDSQFVVLTKIWTLLMDTLT